MLFTPHQTYSLGAQGLMEADALTAEDPGHLMPLPVLRTGFHNPPRIWGARVPHEPLPQD